MDSWVSLCLTAMICSCSSGICFWPSLNARFCVAGNPGYCLPMCALNYTVCCTCLHFVIPNLTKLYRNMKLFKIQAGFRWYCFTEWRCISELICLIFTSFLLIQNHRSIDRAARVTFFCKWVSFLPFLPFASPPWQLLLFEVSVAAHFIILK